jgi:hypothetical protein
MMENQGRVSYLDIGDKSDEDNKGCWAKQFFCFNMFIELIDELVYAETAFEQDDSIESPLRLEIANDISDFSP